ncbi:hypothetical protein ZIOFF_026801 [Zingiber officinale]|uniref:Protein kinase domain-containing protein n=2 Tax=Zingiber officinale TaxID=94328 RepID=A0A8J5GZC5_ZINOF|nr:hypothetical protein ZIOFF_026801 [Zingiber officinale]
MKVLLDNYDSFTEVVGLLGFLICLIVLVKVYRKKKHHPKNIKSVETILKDHVLSLLKRYKYSGVKDMTKSFSCKLGQGGYGIVYKEALRKGHRVAMKILNEFIGRVFENEAASISATSLVNVVGLVGFCLQGLKRALVSNFMLNGSLERFVLADKHGVTTLLDCEKLYDIAMGITRGLEYLHRGCKN